MTSYDLDEINHNVCVPPKDAEDKTTDITSPDYLKSATERQAWLHSIFCQPVQAQIRIKK